MRTPRRATLAFIVAALAAILVTADASGDDVTTTAGKKINGKLVSVDEKGITFSTGEAKVPIPSRDIVVVDLGNTVKPLPKDGYHELELTDGSVIRFVKVTLKDKKFAGEQLPAPSGVTAPTYDIPMRTVFSFMKKADDAKHREAWKKMLSTRGKRDLYVIEQATGLTFIQGTIHSGSTDGRNVAFEKESGGAPENLLQSRSAGFVLYQPQPANIAPTICRVTDVFGNSLNATAIAITPEGVTVTTVAGATVKYAAPSALAKLDYALGNVAYLSDLDPQVDRPELPAEERRLNPTVAFLKDRSLSNDLLKLDNVNYPKGLCIAPDTVLAYNINGEYSQFKATVGIDENGANATSAARLIIEGDGQVLFSETLRRKEKAKGVVLTIKGVKQLRLIVEADTPLNGNYVTLAEVRVQK
jgi:NPCBM/NEW2 domain